MSERVRSMESEKLVTLPSSVEMVDGKASEMGKQRRKRDIGYVMEHMTHDSLTQRTM